MYNYGVNIPSTPRIIAVVGQTAVGKSALALRLAELFDGEIISADSRQVYKYMDIGTDKPSKEEQQRAPHHLIDLVEPDAPFTLAEYQDRAYAAIASVVGRGRLPILAGGTPLYVNAVLEGWEIPRVEPDEELRARLEEEAAKYGAAYLHARLQRLDPESAASILPTNARRIIRALEVFEHTGQPMSAQKGTSSPPLQIMRIGLMCERTALYSRIDARVDLQVERGLVEEVKTLHERGFGYDLRSMSGIGYRQIGDYLQGKATMEAAIQRIKWDTHNFARHQANWFQRSAETIWLDATDTDTFPRATELVREFLEKGN